MIAGHQTKKLQVSLFLLLLATMSIAQPSNVRWSSDGNAYYQIESNEINLYTLPANTKTTILSSADLTPGGQSRPLNVRAFYLSDDQQKILIYTNTVKVWRYDTRGDYWIIDRSSKKLQPLGKERPASSLMFAKLSPDGSKCAYVSEQNLYVENIATGQITPLTTDGNRKFINGTFDWVYEEEFGCRDGFQWSPDGKRIAFWQVDARKIRDYFMINLSDSAYSKVTPVEYPTIGQSPSPAHIGVVEIENGKKTWLKIPGDPQQHYLPRLEWSTAGEIFVQQLDRKQQTSIIYSCSVATGDAKVITTEKNDAWIGLTSFSRNTTPLDAHHRFIWLNNGKEFLWQSDKDGWSHLYRVLKDGSRETLLTAGNYDVINFIALNEKTNVLYFIASPDNATQKYLYRTTLDGKGKTERVSPAGLEGAHFYNMSPNGKYALHGFSNSYTRPVNEWIELPSHKPLNAENIASKLPAAQGTRKVEFFKVKTEDGVEMDGWMVKPRDFDTRKKYPVLFFVYTEPAGQTVLDQYGAGNNQHYKGDMAEDGYIYMSLDGRGTPAPKGSAWRKSIYRKIGKLNIRDQAMAAKEILKWQFVDAERIAVWGHSGGGSTTLNLLFQYPEIYKTGIAMSAVANQLTYDNIYQERYMGLPQENLQDIMDGSPVTYARNLKGNLLYIHGTGDDNVHYNNAEMLINELIKYNKQFQLMAYPNRTHGITEGEGTREHLATLYTDFLKRYCPPGGR